MSKLKIKSKNDTEILFKEGVKLYKDQMFDEAKNKFELALKIIPDSEDILYNLALVFLGQKKYDLAFEICKKLNDDDSRVILNELVNVSFLTKEQKRDSLKSITPKYYFIKRAILTLFIALLLFIIFMPLAEGLWVFFFGLIDIIRDRAINTTKIEMRDMQWWRITELIINFIVAVIVSDLIIDSIRKIFRKKKKCSQPMIVLNNLGL